MAGMTEVYTSAPYVLIETRNNGILDLSDDVQNVSVTRRLDAVSSAQVTLNNYATYSSGRYNKIISIGDRAHISFYVDGKRVPQITGRVTKVPILAFQEGAYKFTITDSIGDLQYIYWDPYSMEAQNEFTGPQVFQGASNMFLNNSSGQDNGIGTIINSFLQKVCGFPASATKVAKFPKINDTVKNVVRAILKDTDVTEDELEKEYQRYFDLIFGSGTQFSPDIDQDGHSTPTINGGFVDSETGNSYGGNSAKAAVDIIERVFGASSGTDSFFWNSNVQFAGGWNTNSSWQGKDGSEHTGRYGLTNGQLRETHKGAIDPGDRKASEFGGDYQRTTIEIIMGWIFDDHPDVNQAVFYYLYGKTYSVNSDGTISPDNLVVRGTRLRTEADVKRVFGTEGVSTGAVTSSRTFSVNKSSESESSSRRMRAMSMTMDGGGGSSGSNPSQSLSSSSQQKWTDFVNRYGAGKPHCNFDGTQCWSLYSAYNNVLFGYSAGSSINTQTHSNIPAVGKYLGNGPYWQYGIERIPDAGSNYIRIGSGDRAQRGDVAFWWDSGSHNPYGHVAIVNDDDGSTFHVFEQWSGSGAIRLSKRTRNQRGAVFAGFWRPKIYQNSAPDGSATGTSSGASSDGGQALSETMNESRSSAFALFKYISFWDQNKTIVSESMSGEYALKNDQPAFEYLRTLCNASFRSFMSLPDGSITAFVPDYFGFIYKDGGTPNLINIPMVEVINFNSYFDKSSYVSHYYLLTGEVVGNPMNAGPGAAMSDSSVFSGYGYLSDVIRSKYSSGTVTLENATKADALFSLMNAKEVSGCSTGAELMQRWGVSVKNEENDLIVDHTLTSLYAIFQFLKYWANCFTSSLSITFKPEIIPGLRVRIPDAGVTMFVKSCTHSWDATSGGRTSITTVCPVNDSGEIGVSVH